MLSSKLHSSIGTTDKLYVDDVFSAYTYTGNGSTRTINNGIDLAGRGGLVWCKSRSGAENNGLFDTVRGGNSVLSSNTANGALAPSAPITFTNNGYSHSGDGAGNSTVTTYVSWTFRKAPKFFDVVTYTGNGASSRAIAHSLGQEVGMVMTKATSTAGDWNTYHRSATGDLVLNGNNAQTGSKALVNSATTSTFTVSGAANTNAVTYVAYLFAHDATADGIIQCGSYVGNGSTTGPTVTLGWEPQYVLIKSASGSTNWVVQDNMRGLSVAGSPKILWPNISNAEGDDGLSLPAITINATGFQVTTSSSSFNTNGSTYIYLAIRRPNKPPTTGTEVYNAIARTGTGAAATVTGVGFAPDLFSGMIRASDSGYQKIFFDKLRGSSSYLIPTSTNHEGASTNILTSFGMDDVSLGNGNNLNGSAAAYINHFFRRAPGFFDVVCYTGNGVTGNKTRSHNLRTAPELIITKQRTAPARDWHVNSSFLGSSTHYLFLNSGAAQSNWGGPPCLHTASTYDMPGDTEFNQSSGTYVSYLFASAPGISKVGSYTGNGSSQTINCGFSTGARFILIKRTNSTGDWYVWDTARGIVAANDPHLSLNTTAAEVTTNDSVDPDSTGFIVNQVTATNINVTSATYLYLTIA